MKTYLKILALSALIGAIAGCTEQGREAYHDADQSQSQAAQKLAAAAKVDAHATADALKEDAKTANSKMSSAMEKGKEDAAKAKEDIAHSMMTPKVKSALSGASGLDASNINVDTTGTKITLKGTVPSASQKSQADKIAKGIAGKEYTVDDQLEVVKM